MQLLLILGIVFTIGAITFALQNNIPVTVVLGLWRYDSSLAVLLLVAICLGVLIAGLVSTPSVIKGQWERGRLRRQVAGLENEKTALESRMRELESAAASGTPAPSPVAPGAVPYVGLKSLMIGREGTDPG